MVAASSADGLSAAGDELFDRLSPPLFSMAVVSSLDASGSTCEAAGCCAHWAGVSSLRKIFSTGDESFTGGVCAGEVDTGESASTDAGGTTSTGADDSASVGADESASIDAGGSTSTGADDSAATGASTSTDAGASTSVGADDSASVGARVSTIDADDTVVDVPSGAECVIGVV